MGTDAKDSRLTVDELLRENAELKSEVGRLRGSEKSREQSRPETKKDIARFQQAFESAPEALIWADAATGIIINCNKATETLLQQPKDRIVGRHQTTLHPKEEPAFYRDQFHRHVASTSAVAEDAEVMTGSGERVPVSITATHLMFSGKLIIQGLFRDLREHKAMEKALKESENRFRELSQATFEAVAIQRDGVILAVNDAFTQLSGYSTEDAIGQSIFNLTSKASQDEVAIRFRTRSTDPYNAVFIRKDGSTFVGEIRARACMYEGQEARVVAIRDITERISVEKMLRESEDKFRNLAELSPSMIFINSGGRVVYVNRKCEEAMGYTKKEFYSTKFNFMQLVAPEYHEQTMRNYQVHKKGGAVAPLEYVLIAKDRTRFNAVICTSLIPYEGGHAILGTITDISSQKQAELQLKKSAEELVRQKRELESKNTALKEVLAQIETEKMAIRSQFKTDMEKTVRPIIRRLQSKAPADQKRYLDALDDSIGRLISHAGKHLIGDMTRLTPREVEICGMIRSGMSNKEMSPLLGVSLRTVETHRNRIRKKLGLSSTDSNLVTFLRETE